MCVGTDNNQEKPQKSWSPGQDSIQWLLDCDIWVVTTTSVLEVWICTFECGCV